MSNPLQKGKIYNDAHHHYLHSRRLSGLQKLIPVIAIFVAISTFSLSVASTAASGEELALTDARKVTKTESKEFSMPESSCSTALQVRCNVIIDK